MILFVHLHKTFQKQTINQNAKIFVRSCVRSSYYYNRRLTQLEWDTYTTTTYNLKTQVGSHSVRRNVLSAGDKESTNRQETLKIFLVQSVWVTLSSHRKINAKSTSAPSTRTMVPIVLTFQNKCQMWTLSCCAV